MNNGFVVTDRRILDWEWFTDPKTAHLWEYLRIKANWKENKWKGLVIHRGQTLETLEGMSSATGLSVKSVRTALNHLISTGEVAEEVTRYGRVITVVNYSKFQDLSVMTGSPDGSNIGNEVASKGQGSGNERAALEQYNNSNKGNNSNNSRTFIKPTIEEIQQYILEKGYHFSSDSFFNHYESNGWMIGKNHMKDWKASCRYWESRQKTQPNNQQHQTTGNYFMDQLVKIQEGENEDK